MTDTVYLHDLASYFGSAAQLNKAKESAMPKNEPGSYSKPVIPDCLLENLDCWLWHKAMSDQFSIQVCNED